MLKKCESYLIVKIKKKERKPCILSKDSGEKMDISSKDLKGKKKNVHFDKGS